MNMQILLRHNRSFEITNNGETLQFNETEELSYAFLEHLCQFRLEDGNFSFSFPFDMIEVFFDYKDDGTVIIGTAMYDGTERQELILTASDFFTTFCQALFDYFKRIEENMPLEKYVLDNNPQRNKNKKWKWEMYHQLNKSFNRPITAVLTILDNDENWDFIILEKGQVIHKCSIQSLAALQEQIELYDPIYLTLQSEIHDFFKEDWQNFLYYRFGEYCSEIVLT